MLDSTRARLRERLSDNDIVLDIGGWADPLPRADWVADMMPYETRGLYEQRGWVEPRDRSAERFSKETWIQRDICAREPLPFEDDAIDFVVCSHTLEDIRDPIWVCAEMSRVGKAGYVEVPSRLEEQSMGVQGNYVGWTHHHWLIDVHEDGIEFVFKPHSLHAQPRWQFPVGFAATLSEQERVQSLWWEGSCSAHEHSLLKSEREADAFFGGFVARELAARGMRPAGDGRAVWLRGRVRRLLQR